MPFSSEHGALIMKLYQFKECGSRKFSKINCKSKGLDTLLKKIRETRSNDQRHESGTLKHPRIPVNSDDELVGLLTGKARHKNLR